MPNLESLIPVFTELSGGIHYCKVDPKSLWLDLNLILVLLDITLVVADVQGKLLLTDYVEVVPPSPHSPPYPWTTVSICASSLLVVLGKRQRPLVGSLFITPLIPVLCRQQTKYDSYLVDVIYLIHWRWLAPILQMQHSRICMIVNSSLVKTWSLELRWVMCTFSYQNPTRFSRIYLVESRVVVYIGAMVLLASIQPP